MWAAFLYTHTREPSGHEAAVVVHPREAQVRTVPDAVTEGPTSFQLEPLPAIDVPAGQRAGTEARVARRRNRKFVTNQDALDVSENGGDEAQAHGFSIREHVVLQQETIRYTKGHNLSIAARYNQR